MYQTQKMLKNKEKILKTATVKPYVNKNILYSCSFQADKKEP